MKRFIIILCFFLLATTGHAQDHTVFKGISLNNTLKSFIEKLESKGFSLDEIKNEVAVLKGDFAGVKGCTIVVYSSIKSNIVWKVAVCLPEHEWWDPLKREYYTFKKLYTEKYGEPESYEFFTSPYSEGDGNEMKALWFNKCMYMSIYETNTGSVYLDLTWRGYLSIGYEDSINLNIKKKEEEMVIIEDI